MSKALFVPLQLSLGTVICLSTSPIFAQVTSDGTVNTQVNQNGTVAEITGGETRGNNLFHSFQDFSVPTDSEAFFDNDSDIANIFSRVTGGNISNIDGLIRANDSASLFLINPAGIVFGSNARLDVGGSFYGSSASSILFEGGEFSAVDLDNPPLLTVNAPIGLGFRDEPGDITNRSFAQNSAEESVGLEINAGNTLALVGGDINFEAGEATARGGNIYLGGLKQAGVVNFTNGGSLSFPEGLTLADITLSNGSEVDVAGTGGGNISVNAQNLTLTAGEFGSSFVRGGIAADSTSAEAQAGDIAISIVDKITLNDSRIINQVSSEGAGNSGNINVTASFIELINGGDIDGSTFGDGNAGVVNVIATGDITIEGEDSEGFLSGITSLVDTDADGNSGGVTVSTNNLSLKGGGRVAADTSGIGNAGAVNVTATGDISADGESSGGFGSGITSFVSPDAEGSSGGVTVSTNNLSLSNGGKVDASTFGIGSAGAVQVTATGDIFADGESSGGFGSGITSFVSPDVEGNAGGVDVETNNLNLANGARIDASTFGKGNAGNIAINALDTISIDGESSNNGFASEISSQVFVDGEGDSGQISIRTSDLLINDGGQISVGTSGAGDGGSLQIVADSIVLQGISSNNGFTSGLSSVVESAASGNIGDIDIKTNSLFVANGAVVNAGAFGVGDAGNIIIDALDSIIIDGANVDSSNIASGIFANSGEGSTGNAGSISISTTDLNILNAGTIDVSNLGQGNGGNITLQSESLKLDNEASISSVTSSGSGGNADIQIKDNLTLDNNSLITAGAFDRANGGNVSIDAGFIIAFPSQMPFDGNDIIAEASQGSGGNIDISSTAIFGMRLGSAVAGNGTNDISAGNETSPLDLTPQFNVDLQAIPETVLPDLTSKQVCRVNRKQTENSLIVSGKGGVIPDPVLPLNSDNVSADETNSMSTIPAPLKTSQGKIQPARGIEVTESGGIRLVAYRTNDAGDRLSGIKQNCDSI